MGFESSTFVLEHNFEVVSGNFINLVNKSDQLFASLVLDLVLCKLQPGLEVFP